MGVVVVRMPCGVTVTVVFAPIPLACSTTRMVSRSAMHTAANRAISSMRSCPASLRRGRARRAEYLIRSSLLLTVRAKRRVRTSEPPLHAPLAPRSGELLGSSSHFAEKSSTRPSSRSPPQPWPRRSSLLTRAQGIYHNPNGAAAALHRDVLRPLARATSLLLLHHENVTRTSRTPRRVGAEPGR